MYDTQKMIKYWPFKKHECSEFRYYCSADRRWIYRACKECGVRQHYREENGSKTIPMTEFDPVDWPAEPGKSDQEIAASARQWHFLTDSGLRLHAGEMTAKEIRSVRTVLNAIVGDK